MMYPNHIIISGQSQETTECDDGRQACEEHEHEGGQTLYVKSVLHVTQVERSFSFYIVY